MTTSEYASEYAATQISHMQLLTRAQQHGTYTYSELDEEEAEDYCALLDVVDAEEGDDITQEHIDDATSEYPLAVDVRTIYRVVLTFGGPNSWVMVEEEEGTVMEMTYHFRWGDAAYERRLQPDTDEWDYVEQLLEGVRL